MSVILSAALGISAAGCGRPTNDPYPDELPGANVLYSSFAERPKHLDPARSYSSNEVVFTGQIYEPPLQYHYLKRPYALEPLVARAMPEVRPLDARGRPVAAERATFTEYRIRLRSGIRYQPHPAFARTATGAPRYLPLPAGEIERVQVLADFAESGTRELVADDFVYQIKRLADPRVHSPIAGLLAEYIVGFREFGERVQAEAKSGGFVDLRAIPLEGASAPDPETLLIRLRGRYPQFAYWLAMPFFAPVPWEADHFYQQPGMAERNLTLDWYPVGTGPYMLVENNPNRRMVLARNPNFRGEAYPAEGEPGDAARGWLADAGRTLPFIDRAVYTLEKENIPYWNKFLQGWYDDSGITSDSFDQAVRFGDGGDVQVAEPLARQGIRLATSAATSIFYMGFNMLDPVVGGLDERGRALRRAIAIAVDYEEYIGIFLNGRGIAAQGPLPPGIFGHRDGEAGINPHVYEWVDGRARRRSLDEARRWLAQAGYPDGRDPKTGAPLLLHFDVAAGGPDDKARLDWYRKQFAKLGIQLVIRNTDYNRFQEKMRKGDAQLFIWGWNADYPDPENFLFLLHGPQGKAAHGGENAANYRSEAFDRLFERVKDMEDGPERQQIIDRIVAVARADGPWLWGLYPMQYRLRHEWMHNDKPNLMANNTLKYWRIDPELRAQRRAEWNRPNPWPLVALGGAMLLLALPAWWLHRRRQAQDAFGRVSGGRRG